MVNFNDGVFFFKRAETNLENQDFITAVDLYSRAIEAFRLGRSSYYLPKCYAQRGYCFYKLNKYDKAIYNLTESLHLDSDNEKGWLDLGLSHLGLNHFDKAIECLTFSIELNPKVTFYWENRAKAYLTRNEFQNAKNDLKQIIKVKPDWVNRTLKEIMNLENYYKRIAEQFKNKINNQSIFVNVCQGLKITDIFTLDEKPAKIIRISTNGKIAISVDHDDNLIAWDINSRDVLFEFTSDFKVLDVEFLNNEQFILYTYAPHTNKPEWQYPIQIKLINYLDNNTRLVAKVEKPVLWLNVSDKIDVSPDKKYICFGDIEPHIINLQSGEIIKPSRDMDNRCAFFSNKKEILNIFRQGFGEKDAGIYEYNIENKHLSEIYSSRYWYQDNTYSNDRRIYLDWHYAAHATTKPDYFSDDVYNTSSNELNARLFDISNNEPISSWAVDDKIWKQGAVFFRSADFQLSNDGQIITFRYDGCFNADEELEYDYKRGVVVFGIWIYKSNQINLFNFPMGIETYALSNDGDFVLISSGNKIFKCDLTDAKQI